MRKSYGRLQTNLGAAMEKAILTQLPGALTSLMEVLQTCLPRQPPWPGRPPGAASLDHFRTKIAKSETFVNGGKKTFKRHLMRGDRHTDIATL